jgi:hypothetical protein
MNATLALNELSLEVQPCEINELGGELSADMLLMVGGGTPVVNAL